MHAGVYLGLGSGFLASFTNVYEPLGSTPSKHDLRKLVQLCVGIQSALDFCNGCPNRKLFCFATQCVDYNSLFESSLCKLAYGAST